MAVHKRGYQRYQGPLTGRWTRLVWLPRFAWQGLMQERLISKIFMVALFWPVACLSFVYLSNQSDLLAGFGPELADFVRIDSEFFVNFMNVQATFAVILAAFAGPGLIAPDLANGGLALYFSRPLSRSDYVITRMLVLAGVLSPVTWIPGLLLFGLQSGMAGWNWFSGNWMLGVGVFVGFLLWIVVVSLIAMASSAWVRWRMVAGALVVGVFFVLAGAATFTNQVLRVEWAVIFNPSHAMNQIWRSMLGAEAMSGPGAGACLVSIGAMAAVMILVLERKLRPVEIIS